MLLFALFIVAVCRLLKLIDADAWPFDSFHY